MNNKHKPKVKLCPNGMIKFYNTDGTRNEKHPIGFYRQSDIKFLKQDYEVIYG
jgi:hypothetical protein